MAGLKDYVKEEKMWRDHVSSEYYCDKSWQRNWGWMLSEYECLKKKIDKKTEKSSFLAATKEEVVEDNRKLSTFPDSTNHMYGWVAKEDSFKLDKYGQDFFHPIPLPSLYKIIK